MSHNLSNAEYRSVLSRVLKQIEDGAKLVSDNCNDTGNKHTECSWGLCDPANYPKNELLFGRSEKYRNKKQLCPLDKRLHGLAPMNANGCFYTCMHFQDGFGSDRGDRIKALEFYQITIGKAALL